MATIVPITITRRRVEQNPGEIVTSYEVTAWHGTGHVESREAATRLANDLASTWPDYYLATMGRPMPPDAYRVEIRKNDVFIPFPADW